MTASVKILTVSSMDSSPGILVISPDGSKILINCGEGCQRSFLEDSQRLSSVQTVLLTHISYDAVGGLPGMILTSADAAAAAVASEVLEGEVPAVNARKTTTPLSPDARGLDIIGPNGTQQFLHSLRHFMRREKFPIRVKEGHVQHQSTQKHRKNTKKRKKSGDEDVFQYSIESHSFSTPLDWDSCEETKPHMQQILSYSFTTPPIQGKFLPEKAKALGVPKGPLYGKLKNGQSVAFVDETSGKERTVESHQVVTPASPGVAIIVLYYPTVAIGREVFTSKRLCELVQSDTFTVDLIVHMAPEAVFEELGPERWKQNGRTGEIIEHVHLPTDSSTNGKIPTPFQSAAIGARSRNMLCEDIYFVPQGDFPSASTAPRSNLPLRQGQPMMEYVFIPRAKKGFYYTAKPESIELAQKESSALVEQSGASTLAKSLLHDDVDSNIATSREPLASDTGLHGELFFTGTGSAIPCKHRNVTGMLLRGSDGRGLLLDVGEGTVGQLLRLQTSSHSGLLESIKAVWISHPHADHHLGILRLLHERNSPDPLLLLAPIPIFRFLEEYSVVDPSLADKYVKIECRDLLHENPVLKRKIQDIVGLKSCRTVRVTHCAHAYALIVEGTDFGKLVYSGDCRPSNQLADLAKGADVLIHEATFEDGMEAEAALKRHSTVSEALSVAKRMQAKNIVLTHFSQRYPRIPPTHSMETGSLPIIFAFDYMRLTSKNLEAAAKLTPALRLLYPEEEEPVDVNSIVVPKSNAETVMSVPGLFAHSALL